MNHVMRVREACASASRKAAAAVPRSKGTPKRRRDRTRLAADVERLSVLVVDDADKRRIASEPSSGLDRERVAVTKLAGLEEPTARALRQPTARRRCDGFRREQRLIDMHDDLIPLRGGIDAVRSEEHTSELQSREN